MAIRVGMNGFGRIGRYLARLLVEDKDLDLVAINARADAKSYAHLFKYDSVHGTFKGDVSATDDALNLGGKVVKLTTKGANEWVWGDLGVDIVLETSGKFTEGDKARGHIACGAKKVLISAPGKNVDATIVPGVNDGDLDVSKQDVISSASCTTNCLAPMVKVLMENFGWKHGIMTTIHSYTMSQRILDGSHKDLRRARAAAMNLIPTTTGAARAVTQVIPSLKGKLDGLAVRVPTPDGSLTDLTVEVERDVTVEEVNAAFKAACNGPMKGVMRYCDEPIVSIDVIGTDVGCVYDSLLTMVIDKRQVKVFGWYDNEAGFTNQYLRLVKEVATKL